MPEKIEVIIIVEMIGKPAEHLVKALEAHIERISREKGIKILSKKISEPVAIENSELFSSFAELELALDGLENLMVIIFSYMPSHIEVISPENLRVSNCDINRLTNEITRRLHEYESLARTISIEKNLLENQLIKIGIAPLTKKIEEGILAKQVEKKKPVKKSKSRKKKS